MITIKEFYGDVKDIDESVLAVKSDCLWEKGSLLDIKNLVTPQLFYLHILVNLIGNWKYEGWWFIMCEMVQFVPYIAETLSQAGAEDMKTTFEKVIDCFPGDTRFEDSEEYFDIVNFLQSMASCTGSRAYCSTLFGIVPIKDAAVAEKIAQDIDLVTIDYPAAFGLEEAVRPFRSIMVDAFCQYIPNGESVWKSMHE